MIAYKRKWQLSGKQLFMKPIRIAGFKKIYRGLLTDVLARVLCILVIGGLTLGAWLRDDDVRTALAPRVLTVFYVIRMLLPLAAQLFVFFGLQEVVPTSAWFGRGKKWVILSILSAAANFVIVTISNTAIPPAPLLGVRLSAAVYVLELIGSGLMFVCVARGMWEAIYHCGGEESVERRLLGLERRVWVIWTADVVLSLLFAVLYGFAISRFDGLSLTLRQGTAVTWDEWALLAFLAVFSLVELWRMILRVRLAIESRRVWKVMDILST